MLSGTRIFWTLLGFVVVISFVTGVFVYPAEGESELNFVIGSSTVFIPRSDACGNALGRTCESKVGNVVADALRTTYGTNFAIVNSGGLRDALTCPTTDNLNDFLGS